MAGEINQASPEQQPATPSTQAVGESKRVKALESEKRDLETKLSLEQDAHSKTKGEFSALQEDFKKVQTSLTNRPGSGGKSLWAEIEEFLWSPFDGGKNG